WTQPERGGYVYAGDNPVNFTDPSGRQYNPCIFVVLPPAPAAWGFWLCASLTGPPFVPPPPPVVYSQAFNGFLGIVCFSYLTAPARDCLRGLIAGSPALWGFEGSTRLSREFGS